MLSDILYCLAGFFSALPTCRYTVTAIRSIRQAQVAGNRQQAFFYTVSAAAFILLAGVLWPFYLYARSPWASFVFLTTLFFFFSKARRDGNLHP